jgi:hypothetical protein
MNPFFMAAARAERDEVHKGNRAELAQIATLRPHRPRKLRRVIWSFKGHLLGKRSTPIYQYMRDLSDSSHPDLV